MCRTALLAYALRKKASLVGLLGEKTHPDRKFSSPPSLRENSTNTWQLPDLTAKHTDTSKQHVCGQEGWTQGSGGFRQDHRPDHQALLRPQPGVC